MPAGRPRKFNYEDALDQAILVFWKKGYEGTSMPDLTEAMNMNRPSIYAAFGNKEELFCKALERYSEKAIFFARTQLDKPKLKESVSALLCGAVTSYSCKESPKGCMAVQGALACSDDAKIAQEFSVMRREKMVEVLKQRFDRGVNEGELPNKTDTLDLARFFITIIQGLSIQSASGVKDEALRAIAHRALSILPD